MVPQGVLGKPKRHPKARPGQRGALTAFADTSARVVQTAAKILEEEIAAGIAAAKAVSYEVRETIQGAPHFSKSDYANLIERFRTDAHDVLEVLVTLFKAATDAVSEVAKAARPIRPSEYPSPHVSSRPSPATEYSPQHVSSWPNVGNSRYSTRAQPAPMAEASPRPKVGPTPRSQQIKVSANKQATAQTSDGRKRKKK
jgi:hypothetical protein